MALRTASTVFVIALTGLLGACGGNLAATEETPTAAPEFNPDTSDSVFGEGGVSLNNLRDTLLGEREGEGGGSLPVNKYLWQATLDTLAFLPLASTDPFTGVIATDWGATPEAPGDRFKVTAILRDPKLSAASLKVAVFRETLNENGAWVTASVDPETPLRLEDAILARARQIRIASIDAGNQG